MARAAWPGASVRSAMVTTRTADATPKALEPRPEIAGPQAGRDRAQDPGEGGDRLARGELSPAALVIAELREIRVIGRPIDGVARRSEQAEREQHRPHTVHLGQKRILQCADD